MRDEKFRKALDELGKERDIEIGVLDNHAYDNSVVGITEEGKLIYDYEKMVEEYMEDEGCTAEEAMEWIDYNTIRALPYFGSNAPIVIMDTRESIMERYGE